MVYANTSVHTGYFTSAVSKILTYINVIFAWLNKIVKKRRVFGKMLIVCINAQRQRHFYYNRLKSGTCFFLIVRIHFNRRILSFSEVLVVTNKIIRSKVIMDS
jgi:hypothetical protein